MNSSFFVPTNLLEKLTNATITPTTCDGEPIVLNNQQQPSPTEEVKEQTIDRNNSTDNSSEESFYSSPSLDAIMNKNNNTHNQDVSPPLHQSMDMEMIYQVV